MNDLKTLYNPMNSEYNNLHISLFETMMKSIERTDEEQDSHSIPEELLSSEKLHSVLM